VWFKKGFGYVFIILVLIEKLIILLSISLLTSMEWNIENSLVDIRLTICSVYIALLMLIIFMIYEIIEVKDYELYFLIRYVLIFAFLLSSFFVLYEIRIILILFNNKKTDDQLEVKPVRGVVSSNSTSNEKSNNMERKHSILLTMLNYHNYTGERRESKLLTINQNVSTNNKNNLIQKSNSNQKSN